MNTITTNVPEELKQLDQWVCHDQKKKPISAITGNSNDWPNNLASFEIAKGYAIENGYGMGFCFANQTEFFGIDLDGCRDPALETIEPWAMAIVNLLGSYSEISPSHSGLKIICRGNSLKGLKKIEFGDVKHGEHRQQAEFKLNSGYFALTGQLHSQLPTYPIQAIDPSALHLRITTYKRILAYLDARPPAIQGQGGDSATFATACSLVHGFGIKPTEAAILISDWNSRCVPPWSNAELQHKFNQADKSEDGRGRARGYLFARESDPVLQSVIDFSNSYAPNSAGNTSSQQQFPNAYKAFPTHLLPHPLCQFVTEVSASIGCDPSFVALPLLSALAAAIGDARKLQAKKDWIVPAILWTAFVGESGTAKSPALRAVMKYSRQWQELHRQNYEQLRKQYDIEFDAFESELKRWKTKNLINAGVAKPQPPDEPPFPRTVVNDVTMESLVAILADNPSGLIAIYDELSGWFGGLNKYRSGTDSDGPIWLSIYNAESISVDRKGSGHTFVPSAFVSICGGIQPGLLSNCFTQQHQDSGLLARFLMANPPRIIKQWTEDEISENVDGDMMATFNYLYDLQPYIDELGNRSSCLLQLTDDAKTIFKQFYNEHNKEQLNNSGNLAAAYSKQEEIPLRLSILVHCVKQGRGLVHDQSIDAATMQAAIELTNWFKNEAKRIYGLMKIAGREGTANKLIQWIKNKGGSTTVREVMRSLKRQYPDSVTATAALTNLADRNLGKWETSVSTNGGRPIQTFRLTTVDAPTQ